MRSTKPLVVATVLAAALALFAPAPAQSDPPPWAGRWWRHDYDRGDWRDWDQRGRRHDRHRRFRHVDDYDYHRDYDRDDTGDDDSWQHRHHHDWDDDGDRDHGRWRDHEGDWGRGRSTGKNYGRNADCDKVRDRIRFDEQKARAIEPGRHEKAREWYRQDIINARRDLETCR